MNILLFTHTDLDGAGCAVLAKVIFDNIKNKLDIVYCRYDDIEQKIKEYDLTQYDKVFITDLSVSEQFAEELNEHNNNYHNVVLLDHHKTALHLNKYAWAHVVTHRDNIPTCGTSLFFNYLLEHYIFPMGNDIFNDEFTVNRLSSNVLNSMWRFVNLVRAYDTWEWMDCPDAKALNDLFGIMGMIYFVNEMFNIITITGFKLNSYDMLINIYRNRMQEYINKKKNEIITKEIDGYKVGVVFAENYISDLGQALVDDFDYVVIIRPDGMSFRTNKDIDLSEIAKRYGGGGHKGAAGAVITDEQRNKIIDFLLGMNNLK